MQEETVELCDPTTLSSNEVLALYELVGWTTYADDAGRLTRALSASHRVVTARWEGVLVGLARSISDGLTIVYIQDVLVHPGYQRRRVGTRMVHHLLSYYPDVRQQVLLTDDEPGQRAFYQSLGFVDVDDLTPPLRAFARFVRAPGEGRRD